MGTPVNDLPHRRTLVWIRRVAGGLQCVVYGVLVFKGMWWCLAVVTVTILIRTFEVAADRDIRRIDDFTREAE